MSIEEKILSIDEGIRDLVAEFVFDPKDIFTWQFEPASFFPSKKTHDVPEEVSRKLLFNRTHFLLSSFCRLHIQHRFRIQFPYGSIFRHLRRSIFASLFSFEWVKYYSRQNDRGEYISKWIRVHEPLPSRKRPRDDCLWLC